MREATTRDHILSLLMAREHVSNPLAVWARAGTSNSTAAEAETLLYAAKQEAEAASGMTLQEISQALSLRPPTVLAHLRRLESEGWIRRDATTRSSIYRPAPCFEAKWSNPRSGVYLQWKSRQGIDWRHPLVSRVPDGPAQHVLLRFLDEVAEAVELADLPASERAFDLGIIAYGSCARGDARPGSDIDLLVLSPLGLPKAIREAIRAIAREANLWAERPLHVNFATLVEWGSLPVPLRQAILRDGITVHSEGPGGTLVESAFWRSVLSVDSQAGVKPNG